MSSVLAIYQAACAFAWLALVLFAWLARGRLYGIFVAVVVGIHTLISVGVARLYGPLLFGAFYFQLAVYVHFGMLVRGRLRPAAYRALVSMPANWFAAATLLSWPWAIANAAGFSPALWFVPHLLGLVGLFQSLKTRTERVGLHLDKENFAVLARAPLRKPVDRRPLRIVQITDPHLGPFMSEARLRGIVERAVAAAPDLVLLTGDFVTMESHGEGAALSRAFEPLAQLEGRVFACRGNHDFEAPQTVAAALGSAGVRLLVDEAVLVDTPAGRVHIVGLDFAFRDRRARIERALAAHPRPDDALRLVLLHDPGAFRHIADGEADLVLAGHTHGGQLGLLSLGLKATVVSLLTKIPDHGLWGLGRNRLYVHRGTGHYGFPLRIGVPGEESVLEVTWDG
ncbi:MAG: metallophosphoesterase [Polyangiaceae bacterium]